MLTEVSISPHAPLETAEADALLGLAFLADPLADALELLRHALVGGDDLVERVGDLAFDADAVARHANRKVANPHRLQRRQQLMQLVIAAAVGREFHDWNALAGFWEGLGGRWHHRLLAIAAGALFKRTSRANLQRFRAVKGRKPAAAAALTAPIREAYGPAENLR